MFPLGEQKISYLIIGNGIAGVTAAETLRAEDPQASIGVIADNPGLVYYRPALKDYLGGHVPTEKLWARPTSFYRDTNIAFVPDRVIGLDSEYHMVLLESQKQVRYHKLLLANGASPARLNCPGQDLRGVTTLRTVTDYQNVLKRLGTVRRVVVSGSGTLALETVESLRQRGLEVTHLLRRTTLWSEVLDTTASDLVLQEERRAGVEVRLEEKIVRITGRHGEVSSVITNRGRRIACQMVLVAIGIEPNIKPWQISGVSCGRGVRVDDALRTNLSDIYAAGDLIETRDRLTNRTRVLGQWYPAIQQARSAAYSMLGRSEDVETFRTGAFYNATFLYGLDFASAGLTITPDQPGYQALVADPQPRSYRKVILKEGIPVGLLALGDRKQALALKRAIDHRVNLLSVASRLFSTDFNLRAWLDEQGIPPPILSVGREQREGRPLETPSAQWTEKRAGEGQARAGLAKAITQKVPVPKPGVRGGSAQGQSLQVPPQEEKTQHLTISGEQIGGEEIMVDSTGRQAQGSATTNYEALLAPIIDPALHLHIAETSLSQIGSGRVSSLRIGRQAGVHLLLDEGSVSRQHAEINYAGGHYLLCDLGSTNGTFVNEQRLNTSRPYVLQPNDILRFGNIVRVKFLLRALSYQSRIQPASYQDESRESALRLSEHLPDKPRNKRVTAMLRRDIDEPDIFEEQYITEQAVLNPDGTLSTPGNAKPVAAPLVEQLKKTPALVIIPEGSAQNGIQPQIHVLNPSQPTTIGREEDNDIILSDPTVSRHHAEVFPGVNSGNNFYFIRDLESSYGTLVNQTKILGPHLLSHSDRIKLGSTRIFFIDLQAGKELTTKSVGVRIGRASPTPPPPSAQSAQRPASQSHNKSKQTEHTISIKTGGTRDKGHSQSLPRTAAIPNTREQQRNVIICPRCGVANARIARFCASCSTLIGQG